MWQRQSHYSRHEVIDIYSDSMCKTHFIKTKMGKDCSEAAKFNLPTLKKIFFNLQIQFQNIKTQNYYI